MKIRDALYAATKTLSRASIKTSRLDSLVLLELASNMDRAWLLAHQDEELAAGAYWQFNRYVAKRLQHYPVAFLMGVREFYGLHFKVNTDVLVPRPDTEALVDAALELNIEQANVIDVGTGCGAIAVAIAKHRPKWDVTATDISPAAIKIARANVRRNKVKVRLIESDLFTAVKSKYDIIMANLPYLTTESTSLSPETKREPALALFSGSDGLVAYRKFFAQLPKHLKPGGYVIIEAEPQQHSQLKELSKIARLGRMESNNYLYKFENS